MDTQQSIKQILEELKSGSATLDGHMASAKLIELSVWHSNLVEEIAQLQRNYIKKLDQILEENPKMSVARAKIKAEMTDEYYEMNKAERFEKSVTEEIRNLRRFIKIRENERENSYF